MYCFIIRWSGARSKYLQQILCRYITSETATINSTNLSSSPLIKPKKKWDLYASVLVERLPVLTKTLNSIEKQFQEVLWQIEFENSLKSDHEVQHEKDLKQAELIKKGELKIDLDDAALSKQTAQDKEDAYVDEYKKFKFASRITEADSKNDLKSLNRKLEDILYLLIEQKLNNKIHLTLPQGIRKDGETMRQTAERVLHEKCGKDLSIMFYGNAPCGFYKYKYPSSEQGKLSDAESDSVGAKVFFFRASYKSGNVDDKLVNKYQWATKKELVEKFKKSYAESIQKFLLE